MSSETLPIDEIFWHACQLKPDERDAYLDSACQGSVPLRQRLDRLLAFQSQAEPFLEHLAKDDGTIDTASEEAAGSVIDNYQLLEQIGIGGMGVVFMAEQRRPGDCL